MDDTDELPEEVWVDPNESIPAQIFTTWAFAVHEGDPTKLKTIWVESETLAHAEDLLNRSGLKGGRTIKSRSQYLPANLAAHLRWVNRIEGNLMATIHEE